jgi:hypothetical protein
MAQATEFDRTMMQRCLTLARQALGRTSPNPLVGSVIVQEGTIIGRQQKKLVVPLYTSILNPVTTMDGLPPVARQLCKQALKKWWWG